MKRINTLLIIFFALTTFSFSPVQVEKTTIYIVRHGEKDTTNPQNSDPELSAEGVARSKSLAEKLKKEKFATVFSTKYKRTTQTVGLSARKSGVDVEYYNPSDLKSLGELIKAKYKGKKILIAGHSNTVLETIESFGVSRPVAALTDNDYDFLFKVTLSDGAAPQLSIQHYGQPHHVTQIK